MIVAAILLGFVTMRWLDRDPVDPVVGRSLSELRTVRPGEDTVSRTPVKGCSTVLLFFDRDCPHCMRQVDDWEVAISEAAGAVQFIAVSLRPSVAGYKLLDNPRVQYLGFADFGYLARTLSLTGVPATVVVDASHQITAVFRGTRRARVLNKHLAALNEPNGNCDS